MKGWGEGEGEEKRGVGEMREKEKGERIYKRNMKEERGERKKERDERRERERRE